LQPVHEWHAAPLPADEAKRLQLLRSLDLLDTAREEVFDRVTRVVAELLQVPIALVSLVDEHRQWFKSRVGLDVCETARDVSFCAHALHSGRLLLVEDTQHDARFAGNPLVTGAPHIRFYAGVPLRSSDGLVLGTLCAIDTKPRTLSASLQAALCDLAATVEREIVQREAATADGRRPMALHCCGSRNLPSIIARSGPLIQLSIGNSKPRFGRAKKLSGSTLLLCRRRSCFSPRGK